MAQILIRNLDDNLVKRLKARARSHGRSLEGEARMILESVASFTAEEARRRLADWQKAFKSRPLVPSQTLIDEDRRR